MTLITITLPSGEQVTAEVLSKQNGFYFVRPLDAPKDSLLKCDLNGKVVKRVR